MDAEGFAVHPEEGSCRLSVQAGGFDVFRGVLLLGLAGVSLSTLDQAGAAFPLAYIRLPVLLPAFDPRLGRARLFRGFASFPGSDGRPLRMLMGEEGIGAGDSFRRMVVPIRQVMSK